MASFFFFACDSAAGAGASRPESALVVLFDGVASSIRNPRSLLTASWFGGADELSFSPGFGVLSFLTSRMHPRATAPSLDPLVPVDFDGVRSPVFSGWRADPS